MSPRLLTLALVLAVSACGGGPGSGLNPLRWFGGTPKGPTTLEPPGGFASNDLRQPIARLLSARWEPLTEGRLLVVTGVPPTKGWWDPALLPVMPMPKGRLRPDDDGVLRLVFAVAPPPPDLPAGRVPATPETDAITVAVAIPTEVLPQIQAVEIAGAGNSVSLRR